MRVMNEKARSGGRVGSRAAAALLLTTWAAQAAWSEHVEVRELELDASTLSSLDIDAGAGSLSVIGEAGASEVRVSATVVVPRRDEAAAQRLMEEDMRLELAQDGDAATLTSHFESGFGWRGQPRIDLDVTVPERLALYVNDGSGSATIDGVRGDVRVDDGSGSLSLTRVGRVEVNDGSGSLEIDDAGGDVSIVDGSGSIDVRRVAGSVTVDDGSGGIDVRDVDLDLIIESDGSGGLQTARIGGSIVRND